MLYILSSYSLNVLIETILKSNNKCLVKWLTTNFKTTCYFLCLSTNMLEYILELLFEEIRKF